MKHRAPFDGRSWTCKGVFSVICFAVLSPSLPGLRAPHMPSRCFTLRDPVFRRVFDGSPPFSHSVS